MMTRFEKWFLRRVFKREVLQGGDHPARISNLYAMIRQAARDEFTEDNDITLDTFLLERFGVSLSNEMLSAAAEIGKAKEGGVKR